MNRVTGKVAVVTGGALGIGRSCCLLLAKEGAKVAVTDVLEKDGAEVARQIEMAGGTAKFWKLDVSKEKDVERVFAEIQKSLGDVTVLVNNAGISGANKPTHELTEAEWDELMAVNVKGVFFCTKHAIPQMKRAGYGSIIHMSSIYGLIGAPDVPPYHASKGALRALAKTEALLYAQDKIRVNSLHPGFIHTPMVENYAKEIGNADAVINALNQLTPLGHIGEPDDIGWAVVYLASDESKFVTGSELVVDGGYVAR